MKYILILLALVFSINGIKVFGDGDEDIEVPNGPDGNPSTPVEVYKKYSKYLSSEKDDRSSMTVDALSKVDSNGDSCNTRLNYTQDQFDKEIEWFSRSLNKTHFDNALEIYEYLSEKKQFTGKFLVHTWELYDKAFTFPRVRKYEEV